MSGLSVLILDHVGPCAHHLIDRKHSGGGRMHLLTTHRALRGTSRHHCLDGGLDDRRLCATAVDILNRRLASGEIDRAEYAEKRKLLITEDDL
jgi:Short C-terminal domain